MNNLIKELKNEIYQLGPNWNLFGKVDRMKNLIAQIEQYPILSIMADFKKIFDKTKNDDGCGYVRNKIIDRISDLTIECPECESIINSDEQYQCGTCGGGGRIFVLPWIKAELEHVKKFYNTCESHEFKK